MSYIIEQKIKNRIYLYEVTAYWDKEKKQSRQRRKYLGPKHKIEKNKVKLRDKSDISSKSIGDVSLLRAISKKIGLEDILKKCFPENFLNILNLSFYNVCNGTAGYLYNYWHDEHHLDGTSLYSQDISGIYNKIGLRESSCNDFMSNWSKHLSADSGVYYDITSISSYATSNSFLEWRYNRDGENLEQVNMGSIHCKKTSLPMFYRIFPGSITDVTTLQNSIKYFNAFDLKKIFLIMDRGFFSKANILSLHQNKLKFIQSIPLWLKNTKKLIKDHRNELLSSGSAFQYGEEVLHHHPSYITYDNVKFKAHIYFDEKSQTSQKHNFLRDLFTVETKYENLKFKNINLYEDYLEDNISKKYHKYLKWDKKTNLITRDRESIEDHISSLGHFIILTNNKELSGKEILFHYRDKDKVEKGFYGLKTSLDVDRIRTHSETAMKGKLFVKFISMILYCYLTKKMRDTEINKKYSVKEMLLTLRKLKIHSIEKESFISEVTKKQKLIFKKFQIDIPDVESSLIT